MPDTAPASEAGGVNNAVPGTDAAGNVLANDKGTGLSVVKLAHVSGATGAVPGTIGTPIAGNFGTLTLQANGGYSYVVNQTVTQSLEAGQTLFADTFGYIP